MAVEQALARTLGLQPVAAERDAGEEDQCYGDHDAPSLGDQPIDPLEQSIPDRVLGFAPLLPNPRWTQRRAQGRYERELESQGAQDADAAENAEGPDRLDLEDAEREEAQRGDNAGDDHDWSDPSQCADDRSVADLLWIRLRRSGPDSRELLVIPLEDLDRVAGGDRKYQDGGGRVEDVHRLPQEREQRDGPNHGD